MNSPLVFPPSPGAEEARRRSAADGRPVIRWRHGMQLLRAVALHAGPDARRAHRVGIRRDPAAAASVRAVADGDETVPTSSCRTGRRASVPSRRVHELL
ncbi:glutaredoxin domain-containing protein [Streptomyces albogriseolus]